MDTYVNFALAMLGLGAFLFGMVVIASIKDRNNKQ